MKKKWKDKRGCSRVDRSLIEKGAEMLGAKVSDLILDIITGIQEVAEQVGLKGTVAE